MYPVLVPRRDTDIFFFDAESTGIPHFKLPSEDPSQPHLVELCGLRYSVDGELVGGVNLIVKPEGWTIPDDVIAIHGITNEIAHERGTQEPIALAAFMALYQGCALRVAHNRSFDDRIIRIALMRYADEDQANAFKAEPGECTALLSKPICQLPPTEAMKKTNFKNSFKTPSLAEAFRHLTGGKELVEQHRALPDAQACARVYFLMKGVRMPEFPDDAEVLRNELDAMAAGKEFCGACGNGCESCQHREENPRPLPHGKDECDAAQLSIEDAEK